MFRRRLTIFIVVLALAAAANAETLRLSLADAIHRALGEGTQAALARSAEERARIARGEALSGLLPQADARFIRYNQSLNLATFGFSLPGQPSVVGPFNVLDAQIDAAVQLFNLAAIRKYRSLQEGVAASRFETEQSENDVAAAVARLYLLVHRAQSQIGSRDADVALFARLLQQEQDAFQAGTGTRLDVDQAKVQLARARQALLVAQNDRESALLALRNAIGAGGATDVVLTDVPHADAVPPPVDDALAAARDKRPELKEAQAREREARLGLEAARARLYPSVSLDFVGDYSGNHADDLRWTRRVAGTVALPIFRGDLNANIARARIALHDAEVQRAQRERDVEQDVRRSLLALANTQARLAVARENAVVAEEVLTVARDRRSAGYGSAVELDRAQDTYRQAREDLVAAEADAAAAQFDLEHATGDIRRRVETP